MVDGAAPNCQPPLAGLRLVQKVRSKTEFNLDKHRRIVVHPSVERRVLAAKQVRAQCAFPRVVNGIGQFRFDHEIASGQRNDTGNFAFQGFIRHLSPIRKVSPCWKRLNWLLTTASWIATAHNQIKKGIFDKRVVVAIGFVHRSLEILGMPIG